MKELITIHKVCDQTFQLLPEKAIYWVEKDTLIIGDLHFGKAGHFRKSGIPVSELVHSKDILVLEKMSQKFQPQRIIFLGDLFHSDHNRGWDTLSQWMADKTHIHFQLVLGNHDILNPLNYRAPNLEVLDILEEDPFSFTHIPEETTNYNIAGHLHPAIRLRGKGRQSVKVPCFYFGPKQAVIPAFGAFTGTAAMKVASEDDVYAIADQQVIKVS